MLSRAVCSLCLLTGIITLDSAAENVVIMQHIHHGKQSPLLGQSESSNSSSNSNSGQQNFAAFLSSLSDSVAVDGGAGVDNVTTSPNTTKLLTAAGFSSLQECIEWRVGLLQKIQFPIAAAYR